MDRGAASIWTRVAQAGAVAAVAVGAGALVVGIPGRATPAAPEVVELPEVEAIDANGREGAVPVPSLRAVASRLSALDNAPTPAPEQPAPTEVVIPVPEQPSSLLTFQGLVTIGSRRVALVNDNGRQRFVSRGDRVGGVTVDEVTEDELRLSDGRVLQLPETLLRGITRASAEAPAADRSSRAAWGVDGAGDAMGALAASSRMEGLLVRPPSWVSPQDALLWQKAYADALLSGARAEADSRETISKMMEERRAMVMEGQQTLDLTDEQVKVLMNEGQVEGQVGGMDGKGGGR